MDGAISTRARVGRVAARVLAVVVLGAVLTVAAVMTTAASTGGRPGRVVYASFDAQDVRLSLPATDKPRGLAIFFHGQTGGVDNRMDEPWLQSLVRDGWVVGSSDFHTASWGNDASTQDTVNLVEWAEQETGLRADLFVAGSMGASVSLNAMTHGVAPPTCWYGVKPAIDLTKMNAVPGARRIIAEAYGGEAIPDDRNPARTMNRLPLETRYRMVASYGDTWVLRTQNADKLERNLKVRGGDVSVLTVTGVHDDPSHFDARDLIEFADTCASDPA